MEFVTGSCKEKVTKEFASDKEAKQYAQSFDYYGWDNVKVTNSNKQDIGNYSLTHSNKKKPLLKIE